LAASKPLWQCLWLPPHRSLTDHHVNQTAEAATALEKTWCLYVLRCRDGSLYCGITNDLPKRLDMHREGKGAKYTRGRGPLWLIGSWSHEDMSAALKAERVFKSLSRPQKEKWLEAHLQPS